MKSVGQLRLKKRLPLLLDEIRQRLELLESNLPKRVDAMAISRISKLPYKVMFYREALVWRMAELGRTAFEDFERDKLVSAIVLTRAVVETSGEGNRFRFHSAVTPSSGNSSSTGLAIIS